MAWTCHGSSNEDMVDRLERSGIIEASTLVAAMKAVDRALFAPSRSQAYVDSPMHIGHGATISAPHMHASCLELLKAQLRPGAACLDVGSGTGYLTAVMARCVCPPAPPGGPLVGRAVGVEHIEELVEGSRASARRIPWAAQLMDEGRLRFVQGDGRQGHQEAGPFDAIHVGAAAPEVPQPLLAQLGPGGRLVVPVGPEEGAQRLVVVDRDLHTGALQEWDAMAVNYVPLTSWERQMQRAATAR